MEKSPMKTTLAHLEMASFTFQLIDKFKLNDEDLMAIAGTLFRDAVLTSLTVDPLDTQEDEEVFIKDLFQGLLENCVHLWRKGDFS